MGSFGFVSTLLKEPLWNPIHGFLPEKWRYWQGPVKTGEMIGALQHEQIKGWGWKIPTNTGKIWCPPKLGYLWLRFLDELQRQEVKVLGLDAGTGFYPPVKIRNQPSFPGISDGKAMELLLFINRFRGMLRNYDIPVHKAKAVVIWEEGNLGVTCGRLVARDLRFLSLVNPNERLLERAADLILAETGISPQIYTELASDYYGAKIIIKCGDFIKYQPRHHTKRAVWCELFQRYPSLTVLNNCQLPVAVWGRKDRIPLYPALGEAILRAYFDLNYGFWYGSELLLERVVKLATCFKELGREIAV